MDTINLTVPKQVVFTTVGGVQKLVLTNQSPVKLAVKIRTNHKTALNIHPTHQFIEPNSKKDIIVKLLELHQGVKLQVNYTLATQQMIVKNDSKLTNVDKKDIRKQISVINVNNVKLIGQAEAKAKQAGPQVDDFISVVPQKIAPPKPIEKKISLSLNRESDIVVEQKLEQDQQEHEQKIKKLRQQLNTLQTQIQQKKAKILNKKQQLSYVTSQNSFIPPFALPVVIILGFLLGSLVKVILY